VFANVYDPDSGDSVLLLEEIVQARGGDTFADLSDADVRTVIDALARLHARWWEGPGNAIPEWLPRLDGATWASHRSMFARAWEAFLDSEAARQHPRLAELGEALIPRIHAVQQRLGQAPVTVVHFDFRLSNLFLRPACCGDEVVAIDWQPLSVARGAYDFGYFVSQSLPVTQRRRLECDLLFRYEHVLVEAGIPGVSHIGLWDDYRFSVAYTASYAVATSLIDLANATGRGFAEETLLRAATAVGDLEVIELVKQVGADALG
jgi:aminoglycoside/choline kinase family phosphotransferase